MRNRNSVLSRVTDVPFGTIRRTLSLKSMVNNNRSSLGLQDMSVMVSPYRAEVIVLGGDRDLRGLHSCVRRGLWRSG